MKKIMNKTEVESEYVMDQPNHRATNPQQEIEEELQENMGNGEGNTFE